MLRGPLVGIADLHQQRLGQMLANKLDAERQALIVQLPRNNRKFPLATGGNLGHVIL